MNELEHAITATLRADAQEAEMTTDTARESQKLQVRLDDVDRHKRRNTWIGVIAAAAAVVAVAAGVRTLGAVEGVAPVTPVASSPSSPGTYSAPYFADPYTLRLPYWVTQELTGPTHESAAFSWWSACSDPSTCSDFSVSKISRFTGTTGSYVTAKSYVEHLRSLEREGALVVASTRALIVDSRPATEVVGTTTRFVQGGVGCDAMNCQDLQDAMRVRFVVVDTGTGAPVVVWTEVARTSPEATDRLKEMDDTLASLTFTGGTGQG